MSISILDRVLLLLVKECESGFYTTIVETNQRTCTLITLYYDKIMCRRDKLRKTVGIFPSLPHYSLLLYHRHPLKSVRNAFSWTWKPNKVKECPPAAFQSDISHNWRRVFM